MQFRKMHGLGNDFVIIDFRKENQILTANQITQICDRNFGVGCDLLTVLEPSETADVFARFYNADGSQSDACGNATRCVADIVMKEREALACTIETGRGVLNAEAAEGGLITVDMGAPLDVKDIASPSARLPSPVTVNMGNPHCVFFVEHLADISAETLGPVVESDPLFPNKTNVEFVEMLEDGRLRQRTWERGVGITLACGSGACAVAAAAKHRGLTGDKTEITLDGGSLSIEIRKDGHILMTGPVAYVFDGTLQSI